MRDDAGGRPEVLAAPELVADAGGEPSRDQARSRRLHPVRAQTVSVKRMTKREVELGRLLTTRGECAGGERPCPFVSCTHHLFLDVSRKTGSFKLNFPDLEPDELPETCALDVADRGGQTLQQVANLVNVTRERVRQIEGRILARPQLRKALLQFADGDEAPRRRLPLVDDQELEADDDGGADGSP